MNHFTLAALVPLALAACSSSEGTAPAGTSSQDAAESSVPAARMVSVKVTGMT